MGPVVKKLNNQMMKAVSRRKTTRKAMQPKGAVETGIQRLPRLPQAAQNENGNKKSNNCQRRIKMLKQVIEHGMRGKLG